MARDHVTHPPRDRAADERIARDPAYVPPDGGSRTGGVGSGLAWLLGLGVLVAIGIAIWAWVDDDTAGPEVGATVNEISEDPGNWYGTTVTVSGEIDDFLRLGENAAAETYRPAVRVSHLRRGLRRR